MAESMQGLHRTHRCTEVSNANIGEKVTVMGWVQKRRNLGSLIFVDLRDRSGILQIVFGEENVGAEGFEKAGTLRSEFVIAVEGTVQKRTAAVNESLKTGDIEVLLHQSECFQRRRHLHSILRRIQRPARTSDLNTVIWIFAALISREILCSEAMCFA